MMHPFGNSPDSTGATFRRPSPLDAMHSNPADFSADDIIKRKAVPSVLGEDPESITSYVNAAGELVQTDPAAPAPAIGQQPRHDSHGLFPHQATQTMAKRQADYLAQVETATAEDAQRAQDIQDIGATAITSVNHQPK